MLLTEVYPKRQTLADLVPELLDMLKGHELYTYSSLAAFLVTTILALFIITRGWGIGHRLALIPLAFVPFLITLTGAIWEIASLPYEGHRAGAEPALDEVSREALQYTAKVLLLIPFGVSLSILLLFLSFIAFLQTRNGQLASILPRTAVDRS